MRQEPDKWLADYERDGYLVVPDVLERGDPDGRERTGGASGGHRSLTDGSVSDC